MKSRTCIPNIETEVREGGLTELCQVFVHLNNAKVRLQRCELLFKVCGIKRVSAIRNIGRRDLSCTESLPVDWIKERMTLDILSY